MPSGTRKLSRAGRGNPSHVEPSSSRGAVPMPTLEPPNLPKHFPFPGAPIDSDIFFDFLLALFGIIGAGIQFLYLYRSVWWLPDSYTQITMNFYLIDPNLVILIMIIFLRRLYYQLGCKFISKLYTNVFREDLSSLSRSILTLFYTTIIGILATIVLGNRSKMDVVYLLYPISLYIPIFGLKIQPFFEVANWCSNGMQPIHACSSNPADIRRECDLLKSNLLDRLRQIFFTAAINVYYGSFIPCCFSQPELVYDKWWNIEHGAFIFASSIVFSFSHMIPLRYCDIFHRAVLHSGTWERLGSERTLTLVTHEWRDDVLWPGGAIVKHNKSVWRAMGDCNCIVPGDKTLSWGYQLFILPSYPLSLAAAFQSVMVVYQLYNIMYAVYWYRIFSLAIMVFFNYYSLYKLLRDSLVSYRIYKHAEETDDDKDTHSDTSPSSTSPHNYRNQKNPRTKTEEFFIPQEHAMSEYLAMDDR